MSKRLKTPKIADTDTFFQLVNRIADLQKGLNILVAARDAKIQDVQRKYGAALQPIADDIAGKLALAAAFAEGHRAELLPRDKKSVELAQATFGWRTGNRTVKQLGKKYPEPVVLGLLTMQGLGDYVRTVEEIAKDKILADATDNKTLPLKVDQTGIAIDPPMRVPLADVGLKITQAETFYIEPKVASGETLKPAEAAA